MRGGFVACIGEDGHAVEQAAVHLRWHRGEPTVWSRPGLTVAAMVDEREGPWLDGYGQHAVLTHGHRGRPAEVLRHGDRFALVEWDGRLLRASRDPLGLAPIFYRVHDGAVWLSTEVGPLVSLGPVSPDPVMIAVNAASGVYPEHTGWQGIHRVLAGHTTAFGPDRVARSTPYWTPDDRLATYTGTRDEAMAEFRERFHAAIKHSWEDGAAIALSGGLDSTAIAMVVGTRLDPAPRLVHARFPTAPETHEERYAQAVADALGVPLDPIDGDAGPWDPDDDLDRLGLPYAYSPYGVDEAVYAHIGSQGISVALDGHDGDGVLGFSGGEWGELLQTAQLRALADLTRRCGVGDAARGLFSDLQPLTAYASQRLGLRRPARPWNTVDAYFQGGFTGWRPGAGHGKRPAALRRRPFNQWRAMQLKPLRPTTVMEVKEVLAARSGFDIRHPFAHRDLVEFLVSLPCAIKTDPTRSKPLLRDALRSDLPQVVLERAGKAQTVVPRRVEPERCVERIRASGARLRPINYDRLFGDPPDGIPLAFLINLARAHAFVARATPEGLT